LINFLTQGLYQTNIERPPIEQKEVHMPYSTIPNKIETDLEFEWLLCLASTLQASRRPHLAKAARREHPLRFPRTSNRKFFEREWKRALSFARNELKSAVVALELKAHEGGTDGGASVCGSEDRGFKPRGSPQITSYHKRPTVGLQAPGHRGQIHARLGK
jgi:hypothetical protein